MGWGGGYRAMKAKETNTMKGGRLKKEVESFVPKHANKTIFLFQGALL